MYNIRIFLLTLGIFFISLHSQLFAQSNVLFFSKTAAYKHLSIPSAQEAMKELCAKNNWIPTFSTDATLFDNVDNLKKYKTIVFLMTSGDVFTTNQENSFKKYINDGGGFAGIHSACDTEHNWAWFGDLVCGYFKSHPKQQTATYKVINDKHPSTKHLPKEWIRFDEIYNYKSAVKPQANILLEVDEKSYEGGTMGEHHPMAWYQYYEGGRMFFTVLGHTEESYKEDAFLKHIEKGISWSMKAENVYFSDKWTNLLSDSASLKSNWETYIGVPHKSLDFPSIPKDSLGNYSEAIGLNQNPKQIFTMVQQDGKPALRISGEIFGSITSREEFGDYHLKLEVKWGEKKWIPRVDKLRDSGILYHCVGPNGAFWKVWKRSLECQIQEGDFGDFFALAGSKAEITGKVKPFGDGTKQKWTWDKTSSETKVNGIARISADYEKAHGEWNTVEIICKGGEAIHLVNGKVNMVVINTRQNINGIDEPLTAGKIQIQSEGAEVFYRNIQIKHINEIPKKIKKEAGL
ncbi:MAG: hypothetical protein RL311_1233 [Bacteroidota bacterium]|jgi:type 1 glutamine amidotransferase